MTIRGARSPVNDMTIRGAQSPVNQSLKTKTVLFGDCTSKDNIRQKTTDNRKFYSTSKVTTRANLDFMNYENQGIFRESNPKLGHIS